SKYMSSLAGIGLAGYFLVRNEAIIPVLIIIIIVLITSLKQKRILNILFMLASFSILCILYISFNLHLGNNTGLFQKKTNLTKQYSEQLDLASAAKETYGENKNEKTPPKILEIMRVLIFRFPKNLLYAGERLPGILLSPLILFIAFIWLMSSKKKNPRNGASILWIITLFPFLFYPLIQIEPRHFFIGLTGLQIFGSAGFIVFMNFIAKQTKMQKMILTIGTILLVGGLIPILCLLAWHTEQKRGYHREIGKWIKTNLPENIEIMGDGFGYCNTFWAGIKNKSRIWTENPDKLAEYAKKRQIPILILNEEFLKKANPELIADDINVMKNGINNMTKIKEFSFPKTGRIQIYKLNKKE
ncbi:MAG: hypothetical protein U9O87_10100, partial [Verrucomicrobiota bacterium]|nr:hypothetical protein [Verrucomicrobiota bacterium]